ncbi:extracellular solute-binding protein [Vibrio sp.]|nr:extracellular solute-binding protein [Vibrio sp.]
MRLANKYIFILLSGLFIIPLTTFANTVTLVTGERSPYISQTQLEYGYAFQVVKQAFKREGYQLNVAFYPWSRAVALASQGKYDGLMPLYDSEFDDSQLLMSDGFPGGQIGLLKKRDESGSTSNRSVSQQFDDLAGKTVAQIRGSHLLAELDLNSSIRLINVGQGLQALDMLFSDRVDFMLTDKYTAAFLMLSSRPNYIGQLEFLEPPLAHKSFHVGFLKSSPRSKKLSSVFNSGLAKLVEDGTLISIQDQYGLRPKPHSDDEKIHLTVGTVKNSDMTIMRSHIREFETLHPDIKIDWRVMDETVLRRRLLTDQALSDGVFDVMTIGNYEVPIWAKNGWLHKLDKLSDSYDINDIFPSVRAALSYDSDLYALPFYVESIMTYYRKDLLAKKNLVMPIEPSFSDIERLASELHNPEKGTYGICLRGKADWGENTSIITSFANAFGGRWFDNNWHPQLDSLAWKKAVTFYRDILRNYGPPSASKNGYQENLELFASGRCALWIDATVAAGYLFNPELSEVSNSVGFTSSPKQVLTSSWLWSWSLAISQLSKHKLAAQQFIEWATSKAYIQHVGETNRWTSVPPGTRFSTYHSTEYQKAAPFSDFVYQAIQRSSSENAVSQPVPYNSIQYVSIPEFVSIGAQVGQYMAKMLEGKLSVSDALKYSQQTTQQQMESAGYFDE